MRSVLQRLAVILPMSLAVVSCAGDGSVAEHASPYIRGDLGTLTYRAVDQMIGAASSMGMAPNTPLVVTSLSDTQGLEKSSALGNIVADMARSRLVQDGYLTTEIRLRTMVRLKENEGEFTLSRNHKAILPSQNVAAILTGTYTSSFDKVYISLKLISVTDAHIITGVDYVVSYESVAGLLPLHNT